MSQNVETHQIVPTSANTSSFQSGSSRPWGIVSQIFAIKRMAIGKSYFDIKYCSPETTEGANPEYVNGIRRSERFSAAFLLNLLVSRHSFILLLWKQPYSRRLRPGGGRFPNDLAQNARGTRVRLVCTLRRANHYTYVTQ